MKTLHFVGDSLIEYYDWNKRFPASNVVNAGVAGETVSELLMRVPSLVRITPKPDWIIVMIGTNNVAMQDFSFIPDYQQIIEQLQTSLPSTSILAHGLFPFNLSWISHSSIASVNNMIEKLAKSCGIRYLDGFQIFDKNNNNVRYFLDDGVHISNYGYSVWADALENLL